MPIQRGSQKVIKRYRGTQEIVASYRGTQRFYSSISVSALAESEPDYWYTLDYKDSPYRSYGSRSVALSFYSGSFHDRGGHAYVGGAKSKIAVQEDWSDAAWSASCWLERTGSKSIETLFGRGVNGGPLISLWTNGANEINLDIGEDPLYAYPSTAKIPTSGWYHLAITCELVGGNMKVLLYIDGQLYVTFTPTSAGIPSFSPSQTVTFGNHPDPAANYNFDGNVDDIALWSRTLSPGEVSAIYQGGRGVVPPEPEISPATMGAVSWLPLNGDFPDHGTVPITWNTGAGTVLWGDGTYLSQLYAQPQYNGGFAFDPTHGAAVSVWVNVQTGTIGARSNVAQATASYSEVAISVIPISTTISVIEATFRRGGTGSIRRVFPVQYSTNTWYHVVATMFPQSPGSTTWTVQGYVDGSMVVNESQSMGTQAAVTFNGGRVTAGSNNWADDVSFYNRELTAVEVNDLYSAGPN